MTREDKLPRIGISLPRHLLDRFDEITNYRGYFSGSGGIRDAIRSYIQHDK
jgi:CopG family nickel-responsive transcriptional regulator